MLPSSAQDFIDVPLAYEESAFKFLEVTLTREDDHPGVLPDPAEVASSFYRLTLTKQ